MKLKILSFFFLLGLFIFSSPVLANLDSSEIELDFFWMNGCSACAQMKPFLEGLEKEYSFNLNSYETSRNRDLFLSSLEKYDVPFDRRGYVPVVLVEGEYFIGYSEDIKNAIISILEGNEIENGGEFVGETVKTKAFGLFDLEVSLTDKSIFGIGVLLAFLDSINVCSITVLVFLIIFSLSVGSVKRSFKIGVVFTSVIFLFYFLFMLLLTGILGYFVVQYGFYIRILVILLSAFAGLLLIKDFFWYGKGLSLRIPTSAKPLLEKYMKRATLGSTIILGVLASLVELPCTAIFPLIYTTILADSGVLGLQRVLYIFIYNLVYIWPLVFIVFGTYFSWTKISNIDEKVQKYKKWMKFVAGIALLLIAAYFVWPIAF